MGNKPKVKSFSSVSAEQFKSEVEDKEAIILDIRTPEEFAKGRIARSTNIDYYKSDFKEKLDNLDKDLPYKIYCNSGNRSSKTLEIMKDLGFWDVTELAGGIQAWMSNNYSTCTNC